MSTEPKVPIPLLPPGQNASTPWRAAPLLAAEGYAAMSVEVAGCTFGNGLYRFHDEVSGPVALALVTEAFPELTSRAWPFAYDWLGRQFAIDAPSGTVLLVEPGTGDVLEIPATFAAFHSDVLANDLDAAVAHDFFDEWSRQAPGDLPLGRDLCVGYQVPLFLGGRDEVANLSVTELDVYWTICGQLRRGVSTLPEGARISEVTIEEKPDLSA